MKHLFAFALISFVVGVVSVRPCEPVIPKRPFAKSRIVFVGQLVEISETNDKCTRVAKFKVAEFWKGEPGAFISVATPTTLCCGYNFQVDENYLVYGYSGSGVRPETSVGWIVAEKLDDVFQPHLKRLGSGKRPPV